VAGAEHSAAVTPPKAAAPATPLAQGKSSAPGVATLGVHLTHKTGFPIWDIHLLGQHTIEIGTRSTFSIYNFLGSLVRDPQSPANALAGPLDSNNDPYLLTVNFGQPTGCFALAMLDLGLYCVPLDGAANTKQAFSILSQLLALKTTTGDLQLQPIIRLLPP